MKLLAFLCVLAFLSAGCRSDKTPKPENIVGKDGKEANWKLSIKSNDGSFEFNDTSLRIATNATGYRVAWMADEFNGTAGFNTNTLTVTMNIKHSSGNLDLIGTLHDNNFMSGAGTLSGYPGPRVVNWRSTRND